MSMLPPEVHLALSQLLQGLSSSDNVIRTQAEEGLSSDWVTTRPEILLMGLVEQFQESTDQGTRTFAAVLFRRMAIKTRKIPGNETPQELFLTLQSGQRNAIRGKLLQCLASEPLPHVRNKIGDAVAEIARQYYDEGEQWPELLGALFQASQSEDASQRENAFRIFATTPGIIEKNQEDAVQTAFGKGFLDNSIDVKIAAIEAFASFFRSITKKSQKKYYGAVTNILNILPPLQSSGDSENLTKGLVALIELAEIAPIMFRPFFHGLVQFSVSVMQDKDLTDTARQNALELMATFADYSPVMCKKDESYASDMVTQCLNLMTDIGEDDEDAAIWNASEDLDVEESDLNHVAGEQCMDRLANKLGGPTLLPPTFNWLPRMLQSTSWKDRHAALMAISAISEGCRDSMEGELDQVLSLVVPALRDAHPRVRWAGCNALGQMSTDFSGTMQSKYHQIVLTNIIPVLESTEPRVQAHAAAALVNFCEEAEKAVLEPYLDDLLGRLLLLLRNDKRFVMEQALSTIATIADSAETAFGKYYDTLMPLLFIVLRGEQGKEFRLLRAKAMECATLIAVAVGKEKMGQDAFTLLQILGQIQQNIQDADDPQAQYLLHCWGRMCRVLGSDFVPYLPSVMPPLMELASVKADIQLLEDEEQISNLQDEEGWELVPIKGKVIGIKTSILEEKHMAIELIVVYAQHLEAAFEPYVADIMDKVSLPGLAFFFHDPVRVASARSVPVLLNSYKKAHGERSPTMAKLWDLTMEKVLEVLTPELAIDTLGEMYQCFYESVEVLGKDCLTPSHMATFIQNAKEVLEDYQARVRKRNEERQDVEDGEEESEDLLFAIEDDQNLLSDMNKAFHTIFKNHGASFLASWARLIPFYDALVTNPDATQRQWAICIYDDVLEFCGEQSWSYQTHIKQPLMDGMRDEIPANRQAACYGIGQLADKGGPNWADFLAESLPLLFAVCSIPTSREDDHVYATENACAAIAKILHRNASKVQNQQEIVTHWLNTLPVINDEEAAPHAYGFLVTLIDSQNPAVLASASKCFQQIVAALDAETLQGNNAILIAQSGKRLVQNSGIDAAAVLATFPIETQQTVQTYFA
ncbi:hypothetical protein MMC25_004687 [Agyrium rufum]|nr:hypothetical protein [Agyrium rufum]